MSRWGRRALAASAAIGALLAGAGCGPFGSDTVSISARFTDSVGLFPGNRVDVLGVPIGRVTRVDPQGTSVLVRMSVPKDFEIPADVHALIIPPSVITDRYVELAPAWTAGPRLAGGAEIPLTRTRTPVEFDTIIRSLDGLSNSLNSDQATVAAIRDALGVGAANLRGNGTAIHRSIEGLSAALGTLADNSADISGLIRSLDGLTGAFARNDSTVRAFSKNVTSATSLLADNGKALHDAVSSLSKALTEVGSFVRTNQAALGTTFADLTDVLAAVNAHRGALTEALDVLPLTFSNLAMAVNPADHRMRINASAAANILNPVVGQQFCDSFGPFLCANAGKPIGSISDAFRTRAAR
jgi:phospholipid/cholesterol/gamma-HCH transport system substrate-binding protein